MKTEELGKSRFLNWILKPAGWAMESQLRHRFSDPVKILNGADLRPGQTVLEVGAGTGFFTVPAARLIGARGRLIAIEPVAAYVERLIEKARAEGLENVDVVQRDALDTGLDPAGVDRVLLLGVLPFPSLPLDRLLPEMHRVLRPDGVMALWQFPVSGWVPGSTRRSGLFTQLHKRNGVYTYRPRQTGV
ncbi:MAG: class I SAM-dependent methyltransferase [Minwuiales bacterium]|nr:class I SAM-dependent methyltransferase [Minwuiales bacterium]